MIKYRPHRCTLEDSMHEMKIFKSTQEMFNAIVQDWNGFISFDDLSVGDNIGKDNRIDWKETRYVCTKRIGEDEYDTPQCIGMCSIEAE